MLTFWSVPFPSASVVKKPPKPPPTNPSEGDTRDKKLLSKAQKLAMKEEAARVREDAKKKRDEVSLRHQSPLPGFSFQFLKTSQR